MSHYTSQFPKQTTLGPSSESSQVHYSYLEYFLLLILLPTPTLLSGFSSGVFSYEALNAFPDEPGKMLCSLMESCATFISQRSDDCSDVHTCPPFLVDGDYCGWKPESLHLFPYTAPRTLLGISLLMFVE